MKMKIIKILKHLIFLIFTIKIGTSCFSKSESDFNTLGTLATTERPSTTLNPTTSERPTKTVYTTTTIQPLGKSKNIIDYYFNL